MRVIRGWARVSAGVLAGVLVLGLAAGPGAAQPELSLVVDGEPVEADMFIENGRTQVEAGLVSDYLEEDFGREHVELRAVLEARGGAVSWDGDTRTVQVDTSQVSRLEAKEIAVLAEEYMLEQNTARMEGRGVTSVEVQAPDVEGTQGLEAPVDMKALVQYEPLQMYVEQEIQVPEGMLPELEGEGQFTGGMMETSRLMITEEAMYQEMDGVWVAMDFAQFGMDELMVYMLNMDPATSLEWAQEYGVEFSLLDDPERAEALPGNPYLVQVNMDEEVFSAIMEDYFLELLAEMDPEAMGEGVPGADASLEDSAEEEAVPEFPDREEIEEQLQELFEHMEMNLEYVMAVDRESFATPWMEMSMSMHFAVPGEEEGEKVAMTTTSDMKLEVHDYGEALDFPEIEDAISLEDWMEMQFEEMEEEMEGERENLQELEDKELEELEEELEELVETEDEE